MKIESIQPEGWSSPKGYSNGMLVSGEARYLFISGQIAWSAECQLVGEDDFVAQLRQALFNVLAVVQAAGGEAENLVELTIFVVDKTPYAKAQREIGKVYRDIMGRHFPAMALVQVADLLEPGALVEVQGRAALPPL